MTVCRTNYTRLNIVWRLLSNNGAISLEHLTEEHIMLNANTLSRKSLSTSSHNLIAFAKIMTDGIMEVG